MPKLHPCPNCGSFNKKDALHCHTCGEALQGPAEPLPEPSAPPVPKPPAVPPQPGREATAVVLKQVMGGQVYSALLDERRRRVPDPPPPPDADAVTPADVAELEIEDNSDVIAAAMDRIRAKAHEKGQRFKPYGRS